MVEAHIFKDQVAIVTGAGEGIGYEIAPYFFLLKSIS